MRRCLPELRGWQAPFLKKGENEMKHFVITVGCEFGSGGPEIGKMLAKSLGIEYYDRDLVDKVVEKIGVEKHLVEEADNKNFVPYGIETSLGTRYANLSNKVIYTQFDVIRKMAKTSCVIIGRCSDYILKGQDDVVNVFVYAPTEVRIKTIMEKMNLSERHAAEVIRDYDNALHRRYKYITGTYRGDRHNRHLLVDSSVLGWEKTAKFIKSFVEMDSVKSFV